MNPVDLLTIANSLADGKLLTDIDGPHQTELCQAVSATYYALFHTLCLCCADSLAGTNGNTQNRKEWHRIYRALEHGLARNQCENKQLMVEFIQEVQNFGGLFVEAQRLRQIADYAYAPSFTRSEVANLIDEAERAIVAFNAADQDERRAFAIHVLFRQRT